jgi:hypothetical protein
MTVWRQMIMSLDTYWPHDASHYSKVVDKRAECLNPWHRSGLSLVAGADASQPLRVSPEILRGGGRCDISLTGGRCLSDRETYMRDCLRTTCRRRHPPMWLHHDTSQCFVTRLLG